MILEWLRANLDHMRNEYRLIDGVTQDSLGRYKFIFIM